MRIDILTLFPGMFEGPFSESILQRAIERGLVSIDIHNIRDYTYDRHHTVDDYAYGSGVGMVMKPDPIFQAVESIKEKAATEEDYSSLAVVLLTPQGRLFCQKTAEELSGYSHLMLICGRYEGFDERVREHLATDEISIGDYVLSGGELPAMVVADAIVRLIPGVVGSKESVHNDSHSSGLLEYPQYTRPEVYRGWSVPEVLLSGNHAEIARWQRQQSILRTLKRRPELIDGASLTEEERSLLKRRH